MLSAGTQPIGMGEPSAGRRKHRQLPYLTLVLLTEVAVFTWLLRQAPDPVLLRRIQDMSHAYRQFRHKRHLAALMKNDPRIGEEAPPITATPVGFMSSHRAPTLLVFIGSCASCVGQTLSEWEEVQKIHEGLKVLIVSRDSEERVRDFLRSTGIRLPIIPDPDGRYAKRYNALWTPRCYGIDERGRIVWVQGQEAMYPAAIAKRVCGLVRRGKK